VQPSSNQPTSGTQAGPEITRKQLVAADRQSVIAKSRVSRVEENGGESGKETLRLQPTAGSEFWDLLHIRTKRFTRPKLPTTAGSVFCSLIEDPTFGEKP
jgi:hypothetical protein